ncbi:45904_t:CDS:2, partial [Gigaspora margarita]
DNQADWSKTLNNRKVQNPRLKTKTTKTKVLCSKKIDRKLSSIQAEGISRYRQTATIQNFLKINTAKENPIDPVLPIDWDYVITIANKVNIEKDKQTHNNHEVYSNITYKQSAKKLLSQEELNFIKFRDKIESSAVKVTHVTGDNQEKIIRKKKLLVDNECGTMDYGLEETLLLETTKETTTIHKETETAS